jgi:hypothetical protein
VNAQDEQELSPSRLWAALVRSPTVIAGLVHVVAGEARHCLLLHREYEEEVTGTDAGAQENEASKLQ